MKKMPEHILKSTDVNFEGQYRIDLAPTAPAGKHTHSAPPKVRIVQNDPQFALLEITCPCGTKTNVKCQYNPLETGN